MQKPFLKWLLYLALFVLVLLHTDTWFWRDSTLVLGLPIGLFYHIVFCFVAALVMLALVKLAWPDHLEVDQDRPSEEQ